MDLRKLRLALALAMLAAAAPAFSQAPQPHFEDALWVAESRGLLKVATADGRLLFAIPGLQNVRAVAVDARRALVWLYAERKLQAYGFDGEEELSIPISSPNPSRGALAVNPDDGSVWLGAGKDLWSFSFSGQLLQSVRLASNVEALGVDAVHHRLWTATAEAVTAYDLTSASPLSSLGLGSQPAVRDLSVDPFTGDVWIAFRGGLRRYTADGFLAVESTIPNLLRVAAIAHGAWAATAKDLSKVGFSGEIAVTVQPFRGESTIVELVADPRDGSVWLANQKDLAQVSAAGELLRSLGLQPPVHVWDLALYADAMPPEIAILAPSAGAYLGTRRPGLELRISDVGSGFDPATLAVHAHGAAVPVDCAFRQDGASCSLTGDLIEGPARLAVGIEGSLTHQPQVVVAGSLSEPATLTINGQPVPVGAENTFSVSVPLLEGANSLSLGAMDRAGNLGTRSLTVKRGPPPGSGLPPDPATVAPALDPTVVTDIAQAVEFLYTGAAPLVSWLRTITSSTMS